MTDKVLFEKDGRIARITLNRPEVLNAIDDEVPALLSAAVAQAETDPEIHVISTRRCRTRILRRIRT